MTISLVFFFMAISSPQTCLAGSTIIHKSRAMLMAA